MCEIAKLTTYEERQRSEEATQQTSAVGFPAGSLGKQGTQYTAALSPDFSNLAGSYTFVHILVSSVCDCNRLNYG